MNTNVFPATASAMVSQIVILLVFVFALSVLVCLIRRRLVKKKKARDIVS